MPVITTVESILRTNKIERSVMRTVNSGGFIRTTENKKALLRVLADGKAVVRSTGKVNSILQTGLLIEKVLDLKPAITYVSTDTPYIVISDLTGTYNGTTNTWGYNDTCGVDPDRPCRTDLDLYVSYTLYENTTGKNLATTNFFPADQGTPALDPYVYNLFGAAIGIIMVSLVGVPSGTTLTTYEQQNLYEYSQSQPDWFNGRIGFMNDPEVETALRTMQIQWIRNNIAFNCQGTRYKEAYALRKAIDSALKTFNAPVAAYIYSILKIHLQNLDVGC